MISAIALAERHAVSPQQEGLPVAGGTGRGEQADDGGHHDHGDLAQRLDGLAVLVEVLLLRRHRRVDRPGAVADDQAGGHQAPDDDEAEDEEQGLGPQLGEEHTAVADRVEPQHLGPHGRGHRHSEEQCDDDRDGGAERPTPASQLHRRPTTATSGGGSTLGRAALASPVARAEPVRITHATPDLPLLSLGTTYPAHLKFPSRCAAPWSP
jgi:hypothetical protein